VAASEQQAGGGSSPRPRRGGLVGAYALVLGLIAASATFVFDGFEDLSLRVTEKAAADSPEPPPVAVPAAAGSLRLPVRPPTPSGFRGFPPIEAAEMVETTDDGLRLPRISSSGWMPWIAHARRFDPSGPPARIGLLMINVGASEPLMKRAIEDLPGEVSLAFLPGTPDLPRWLQSAREHGHESYLMMPVEDPAAAERGIRPVETGLSEAENVRRLRLAIARGEGYVGLVISSSGPVPQSEAVMRPLVKEIADRGLALVEINPMQGTAAVHRLTEELGVGYARSADVLDYKLAGEGVAGNLDRLASWVGAAVPDSPPRHAFGVVQPDEESIDAIVAWHARSAERPTISLVPIIGHFECREACMARLQAQPEQLRP
jgi:polysaccharide deacetylase 2 family uncharacterized protein YibQ